MPRLKAKKVTAIDSISKLEKLAKEVKLLKDKIGQRRPILIEFCGSPKSGKTTCINALNIFLKRNDFKTAIITEKAVHCPIENKTHPYFNSWTLFSSLADTIQLISQLKDRVDIIIVDRSIFDAICWFDLLNNKSSNTTPYLDDMTYKGFRGLLLETSIWSSLFDMTIVFKSKPEVSLKREYATLLTRKKGSIMNEEVLSGFNEAIDSCVEKYSKYFQQIKVFDTSKSENPNDISSDVTTEILQILQQILQEEIGFIKGRIINKLKFGINTSNLLLGHKINFDDRDKIEKSIYIQPIPIAVITNKERDKVFVVKKSANKTGKASPETNKLLLYIGGHIRKEDMGQNDGSIYKVLENTIHREIQEEIGESYFMKREPDFLIYTPK